MEFPLLSRTPNQSTTTFSTCKASFCDFPANFRTPTKRISRKNCKGGNFKLVAEMGGDGIDGGERKGGGGGGGYTSSSAMEVTTFNQSFPDAEFPVWEKIGAVVRLSYGIGSLERNNPRS